MAKEDGAKDDMVTVIIPAAGFGKRVGSPPAKELLPDPKTGEPLILWSLKEVDKRSWRAVVIVREEKLELINWLKQTSHTIHIVPPTKEWPDTILKSEEHWTEKNLLLLPDTRFGPVNTIDKLVEQLSEVSASFATFSASNYSTWGVLQKTENSYRLCEKPQESNFSEVQAWGLIAFQKQVGSLLFQNMLRSTLEHNWYSLPFKINTVPLDSFRDITR